MRIIFVIIGVTFSITILSQVKLQELIQLKTDSNWLCKKTKLSNGNIDKVYWDSIDFDGVKKNINMGWDVVSPEGIVLERFRRDSLMKTYIDAICDYKGNCISVSICDTSYCLEIQFRPDGGIGSITNYIGEYKNGYKLRINEEGIINERTLYKDGYPVKKE